jgi:hypothetical protein
MSIYLEHKDDILWKKIREDFGRTLDLNLCELKQKVVAQMKLDFGRDDGKTFAEYSGKDFDLYDVCDRIYKIEQLVLELRQEIGPARLREVIDLMMKEIETK